MHKIKSVRRKVITKVLIKQKWKVNKMVFSQITTTVGEVNSISIKANYFNDPLELFSRFTTNNQNALLLESAEIDSKDNLKSLMLIDTAVKFECMAR